LFVNRCRHLLAIILVVLTISFGAPEALGGEFADVKVDSASVINAVTACKAARQFQVPVELIAGVVLAEQVLNRGWKDRTQDAIFQFLLEHRDEKWWSQWAEQAMAMADRMEEVRIRSNKWPVELAMTGIIFSIGPAQITPRTAMKACSYFQPTVAACDNGIRSLIAELLSEDGSIAIAALVLRYEYLVHLQTVGADISSNLAGWATLYNYGGPYYRKVSTGRHFLVNDFGNWVDIHLEEIRAAMTCDVACGACGGNR
jgi:hypothetical protein